MLKVLLTQSARAQALYVCMRMWMCVSVGIKFPPLRFIVLLALW